MKNKLLSLKQKRELLQRMTCAIQKGRAMDAFYEQEGVDKNTLSVLLREMRAIGTKGISPFFPDQTEVKRLPPIEKIRIIKKMKAYLTKTKIMLKWLCEIAGITQDWYFDWVKALQLYQEDPATWRQAYLTKNRTRLCITPAETKRRTRLVNSIIRKVNRGASLKEAIRNKIGWQLFYSWEKRYATIQRVPPPGYQTPFEERQRRKRLVNSVIRDLNKGMTYKEAFAKVGINGKTFYAWAKAHGTVKRLWGKKGKVVMMIPPQEVKRRRRLVGIVVREVNQGTRLEVALKKAGITLNQYAPWKMKYGSPVKTLYPYTSKKTPEESAEIKRQLVQVMKAMRRGATLTDATREAGIPFQHYYYWKKKMFPQPQK